MEGGGGLFCVYIRCFYDINLMSIDIVNFRSHFNTQYNNIRYLYT